MRLALDEARKCTPVAKAFCVGAVIVKDGAVISTGYSRELEGNNTHAEQCAIDKLVRAGRVHETKDSAIYTTMEPCSTRASDPVSCTTRCLQAGFSHVYLAVHEPSDFVECQGTDLLVQEGVTVTVVEGLADEALRIARGNA
ncbi:uncharacterized protein L969DRAFT_84182 [Mixia osmundae IAM 14324]|uniref:CMP/dCMP-type deaminase domain-containing protein n=1 Tax=Mixia osmundae (strain CBS 9802 / IAM 14324 / JCM 22182 / KY 12970) TaxID=764103 RepID=G7EAH2_MIXOS|nr:uncharacterized protein L969DRAFT_84182 [Mixia osmundae IAM 14324]KEI42322.1 hypothetical protein L969DRAFT_84182 [Mixia osmundae IAM 14324]GAA99832.1 hypothetical protein E5Q_06535 [Mixia osmundae IAM 14324]